MIHGSFERPRVGSGSSGSAGGAAGSTGSTYASAPAGASWPATYPPASCAAGGGCGAPNGISVGAACGGTAAGASNAACVGSPAAALATYSGWVGADGAATPNAGWVDARCDAGGAANSPCVGWPGGGTGAPAPGNSGGAGTADAGAGRRIAGKPSIVAASATLSGGAGAGAAGSAATGGGVGARGAESATGGGVGARGAGVDQASSTGSASGAIDAGAGDGTSLSAPTLVGASSMSIGTSSGSGPPGGVAGASSTGAGVGGRTAIGGGVGARGGVSDRGMAGAPIGVMVRGTTGAAATGGGVSARGMPGRLGAGNPIIVRRESTPAGAAGGGRARWHDRRGRRSHERRGRRQRNRRPRRRRRRRRAQAWQRSRRLGRRRQHRGIAAHGTLGERPGRVGGARRRRCGHGGQAGRQRLRSSRQLRRQRLGRELARHQVLDDLAAWRIQLEQAQPHPGPPVQPGGPWARRHHLDLAGDHDRAVAQRELDARALAERQRRRGGDEQALALGQAPERGGELFERAAARDQVNDVRHRLEIVHDLGGAAWAWPVTGAARPRTRRPSGWSGRPAAATRRGGRRGRA
jgi:hypothetical protein